MEKTAKETGNGKVLLEMVEGALKGYEQALRTGLKLQQEAAQWWSKSLQQAAPTPDLQKWFAGLASTANTTVIPAAQKQLEEVLHLLEKNNQHCVDLVRKATEAAQTSGLEESRAKWIEFWKSSMVVARANAEALTAANGKMVDQCIDFVKKSSRTTVWPESKAA